MTLKEVMSTDDPQQIDEITYNISEHYKFFLIPSGCGKQCTLFSLDFSSPHNTAMALERLVHLHHGDRFTFDIYATKP